MRIAIFSNSSTWGGLETHAVALAETLASAHHEVSVVCFGTHAFELYRGRLASSVKLVDLGPPEQRTFWRWWHTLGTVDADAAILEKGTLWTGSVGLDVALRLRFKRFLTIQQLEPPLLPPKASR